MILQLVGCSHRESAIGIRERLAFRPDQVLPFLDLVHNRFPDSEAVLLSTCNRTEFYVTGRDAGRVPSPDQMIGLLAEHRGLDELEVKPHLFHHSDRQAVFHLFSVAASLDSMVLGEAQILSQVKDAYKLAVETNRSIPLTHHVFQAAIGAARRVARETSIHENRVSIPSIAVGSLAGRIFERLDNKKVLVIGAGKMAAETLTYLLQQDARDIVLVNRTLETARKMAETCDGIARGIDDLEQELTTADLVVSTTAATRPLVTVEMFDRVAAARNQRPLLILDLAVPRDFEPAIGDHLNVYLYAIDDLQAECNRNRKAREAQWPAAEKILLAETDEFLRNMKHREGTSTISQLRELADNVKTDELQRLMNRLEGVDDEHRKEIEYSFNRLVNKILHPPLDSLKNLDSEEEQPQTLLEALKRLFQLGD